MPLGAYRLNGLAKYFVTGAVFDTISATGGDVEDVTIDGITYRVHKFYNRQPKTITTYGSLVTTTTSPKFSGVSIAFDGTDDYIDCGEPVIPASGDFTVEAWVWVDTANTRYDFINQYVFPGEGRLSFNTTTGNKFEFFIGTTLGNVLLTGSTSYAVNTWYHVAAVRKDNKYYLYLNGALEASDTAGKNITIMQSQNTNIGRRGDNVNYLDGKLSEIRISNIARYTATFPAPTLYFHNDNNTLLLIKGDRYAWTDATAIRDDHYEGTTNYTFEITDMGNSNGVIEYMLVGGGGGGGSHDGIFRSPGGGGGGGLVLGQYSVIPGTYTVAVGHGGRGYPGRTPGGNGFDSLFDNARAIGGGGGGYYSSIIAANGGSGGGASTFETGIRVGGSGISGQGYDGGDSGDNATDGGGGGGGAGGPGQDGPLISNAIGGNGGLGLDLDFTGTSVGYAGGGGGSAYYATVGGSQVSTATHGGGNGWGYYRGEDGTDGTGGGGGAGNGGGYTTINGGYGGAGIIAIRYPISSANNIAIDGTWTGRKALTVIARGNAQIAISITKFGEGAISFDGTGDYLEFLAEETPDLSGNFTIECWIRFAGTTTTQKIIDTRNTGDALEDQFVIQASNTSWQMYVDGTNRVTVSNTISNSTWYHIAAVRSGANYKFFVDGTSVADYTSASVKDFTQHFDWFIGNSKVFANQTIYGRIDEFRMSKIARYTGNFTPATSEFANDSNTLLLLHGNGPFTSQVIRDSGIEFRPALTCTAAGNARISTGQSKFGGRSGLFDGTGDKVIVGNGSNTGFKLGARDYTIECWIRRDDLSPHRIFDCRIDGTSQARPLLTAGGDSNNQGLFFYLSGANRISASNALPSANTWYHVALVRSNRWTKLYVDGKQVGSHYLDPSNYLDFDITIGAEYQTSSANDFDGYIDEFRVSSIARYKDAFEVPTQPFQPDIYTLALLHMEGPNDSTVFFDNNN